MANWSTNSVKTDFAVGDLIKNANTVKEKLVTEISDESFGDDLVVGIDEPRLKATIRKIRLIDNQTTLLFNDLDEIIKGVDYFSCSATSTLNKVLNDISGNIPTIKSNITSYIDDLNLVLKGFGVIEYNKVIMINKAGKLIPKNNAYIEKEKL